MSAASGAVERCNWIAVDWGTSHVRAWAMADETVVAVASSDAGMGRLTADQYEPALLSLVETWLGPGVTPVFVCGMAGARQGWVEAPYRPVPCSPVDGAGVRAPTRDPRLAVAIVAGLSQSRPADVMRGEETQIAGFLAAHPDFDGALCLPGTHVKWAHVSAGEVVSFRTAMTGELYALLADASVLRHGLDDEWDATAFAGAVETTLLQPAALSTALFGIRAEALLHGMGAGVARARLSGLLIGAELAATKPWWLGRRVVIIGEAALASAYDNALRAQGLEPERMEPGAAARAGLVQCRAQYRARSAAP